MIKLIINFRSPNSNLGPISPSQSSQSANCSTHTIRYKSWWCVRCKI